MFHEPVVLLESRADVIDGVGPDDAAKVGHPARNGHVAQVRARQWMKVAFGKSVDRNPIYM